MPQPDWLILHGRKVTAILECYDDEAPLWRYWGPRLGDGMTPGGALRKTRPLPTFSLDFDQPLSLFTGLGAGWFGQSALLAHRGGEDWTFQATACAVDQSGNEATVRLCDDVALIEVEIRLTLDPESDVLSISTTVSNQGTAPMDIQWLAAGGVPLPSDAQSVRSYGGRHNGEFVAIDDPLTRSLWRRENRRGLTSHDAFPGGLVACENGITYGVQLAWSGNHVQQIDWLDDDRWHWQMGEWLAPGEVQLPPGGSIAAPAMLATCAADSNGVAQNFHAAIRARLNWPDGRMKPRPVHLNTWEGIYFSHDEAALMDLATSAAEVGIERFVLDDGWFAGRNDDRTSLGDWWADPKKYPDGLKPLADHVTGLGLEFGLWVEPEMVNPDSDLYRAHPDWTLNISGRPDITARNQLVLDLTRPEVVDYLFDKIAALLSSLPITYLKWDHNRDLTLAGAKPRYRSQVYAAYALMSRITSAFPHVEIEACAGGGGRIDAGIAQHTHRFWLSDNNDAISRIAIQRGFLQFMPPELMGAHIGAAPSHATGRVQSLNFRAQVALPGHLGVEFDVRKVEGASRDALKNWIASYKSMRDQLHTGKVWMGDAGDSLVWQAHGNKRDMILFLYRIQPSALRYPPVVKLPMLGANTRYNVQPMGKEAAVYDGSWLRHAGLPAPYLRSEQALIVRLKAE